MAVTHHSPHPQHRNRQTVRAGPELGSAPLPSSRSKGRSDPVRGRAKDFPEARNRPSQEFPLPETGSSANEPDSGRGNKSHAKGLGTHNSLTQQTSHHAMGRNMEGPVARLVARAVHTASLLRRVTMGIATHEIWASPQRTLPHRAARHAIQIATKSKVGTPHSK